MPESPAVDQLQRILYLIPAAAREGGVTYEEAAGALGVAPEQIRRDAEELAARCFSHPAGTVDDFEIGMEADRVEIWTTGEFQQPARLTARETLALELGLRLVAGDRAEHDRGAIRALGEGLQAALASEPAAEDAARFAPRWGLDEGAVPVDGLRGLLLDAVQEHRRVRVTYVKPADREPSERVLEPLELVFAEGRWYVLAGEAADRGEGVGVGLAGGDDAPAVKAFRVDRVLEAAVLEASFERPDDFDPGDYLADGRVFRAYEELRVPVRFAPHIAAMISEGRGREARGGEARGREPLSTSDSSTPGPRPPATEELVVSDPAWLVAHVLFHAGDAEVLEESSRGWVAAGALHVVQELAEGRK